MADPNFPNRPQHPDFWALSKILIAHDARVERDPAEFEKIVTEHVDMRSIMYVSNQRAIRTVGTNAPMMVIARTASVWLDAFLTGIEFQQAREKQ